MIKLRLGPLLTCASAIARMRGMTDMNQGLAPQGGNQPLDYEATVFLANQLARVIKEARTFDLQHTADGAQRALDALRQGGVTHAQSRAMLIGVQERLEDEGLRVSLLALDRHVAPYFADDGQPLFGATVNLLFPSARYDIAEAGRCLALERHTACVMHLMRALEPVVAALAAHLSVTIPPNPSWGPILDRCEAAIRDRTIQRAPEDKTWLAQIAAHLQAVKNAFRNDAMHAHARFGPDTARETLDGVGVFMRDVAERLGEGDPSTWEGLRYLASEATPER